MPQPCNLDVNIQEENSACYFAEQSEHEQTLAPVSDPFFKIFIAISSLDLVFIIIWFAKAREQGKLIGLGVCI